MVFDGKDYFLFNEDNSKLNYNKLSPDLVNVFGGETVLDVGDHTGDADLGFFNNQWHMFFDDGPHLHYNIGYANTTAEEFPKGWKLENDIYGPHNPEQGQLWDDDTPDGNEFGTGDADIALEGTTLYMFTERPVSAAYRELNELFELSDVAARVCIYVDINNDGAADDSSGWHSLSGGNTAWGWGKDLLGQHFKVSFKLSTSNQTESPLIKSFKLTDQKN